MKVLSSSTTDALFYAVGPLFSAIASKIKIIRIKKPKNS
jgi:hypothetical protein